MACTSLIFVEDLEHRTFLSHEKLFSGVKLLQRINDGSQLLNTHRQLYFEDDFHGFNSTISDSIVLRRTNSPSLNSEQK